jgi:hypothetical protein
VPRQRWSECLAPEQYDEAARDECTASVERALGADSNANAERAELDESAA